MVRALCCLHNWLIDEHDVHSIRNTILPSTAIDQLSVMDRGGDFTNMTKSDGNLTGNNTREEEILDGVDHLDDTNWNDRRSRKNELFKQNSMDLREYLLYKLQLLGITNRPNPMGSTTTHN